ncbi:MAG: hypothetical protein WCI63_00470 [bacterium]
MIKTKIFSYFNIHKYRILLSVFLLLLIPAILLLPNLIMAADPLGIATNFKEGIVSFITAIGAAATKYSFMLLKMAMQTSTDLISEVVNAAPTYGGQANVGLSFTAVAALVRDSALSFLGIIVIVMAFSQVLHVKVDEWGAKALLPKLFLASLMSLFSLFICSVIYDFALVVTNAFALNTDVNVTNATALAANPVNAMEELFRTGDLRLNIMAAVVFLFTCILLSVGYLILAIILFFRTIFVLILMAVSPLAFVCMVLPWTNGLYKKWWQMFAKWIFYLPAAYIILNVGTMVMMAILSSSMYTQSITDTLTKNGSFAQGSMLALGQLFVPSITALIVMGAAIIMPFSMLGKAGGIASSLSKKAGKGVWQASPGGTAQNMWKQASSNRVQAQQTKAGRALSGLQRKIVGKPGEDGKQSAMRMRAGQMITGRDAQAMAKEIDGHTSTYKNLGGSSKTAEEYKSSFAQAKKDNPALSDKDAHKKALDSVENVEQREFLSKLSPDTALRVATTTAVKDDKLITKLGFTGAVEVLSAPEKREPVNKDKVKDNMKKIDLRALGQIKVEHVTTDLQRAFGAGPGEVGTAMRETWADDTIKEILKGVTPDVATAMRAQLAQTANSDQFQGPTAPPPPDTHVPPPNSPYNQPLPDNAHETTEEWGPESRPRP